MRRFRPEDVPLALPHLERVDAGWTFLGTRLADDLDGWPDLAERCDGVRTWSTFDPAARALLDRARAAGLVLVAGPPPTGEPTRLVVSPHPDDAILSLGGVLDGRTTVLDVFSRERWTQRGPYLERPELVEALIAAEERVAGRTAGVRVELLGWDDAPLRPAWATGYLVAEDDPSAVLRSDPTTFADLVAVLAARVADVDVVVGPLGSGGHVDHVLCREAVLRLVLDGVVDPARVQFYEDQPPCLFSPPTAAVEAVGRRVGRAPSRQLLEVDGSGHERKAEALAAYRLQVPLGIARRILTRDRGQVPEGSGWAAAEAVWLVPDEVAEGDG